MARTASNRSLHIDDFFEKFLTAAFFDNFRKEDTIANEQNPIAVAGGKRIVGDHQDRRFLLLIDLR
jgi:hypothetical protein